MPLPAYFDEKRYSYHVLQPYNTWVADYSQGDDNTAFESQVRQQYDAAYALLKAEKYSAALSAFEQLENLILTTVHPTLPATTFTLPWFKAPLDPGLIDVFATKIGSVLSAQSIVSYTFPKTMFSEVSGLPAAVTNGLAAFGSVGLRLSAAQLQLTATIDSAVASAAANDWASAAASFTKALPLVPASATGLTAAINHDLAIATEKSGGDTATSVALAQKAADQFGQAQLFDAQVEALTSLAGIQSRSGDQVSSAKTLATVATLQTQHKLFPVQVGLTPAGLGVARRGLAVAAVTPAAPAGTPAAITGAAIAPDPQAPRLLVQTQLVNLPPDRTFNVLGAKSNVSFSLTGTITTNVHSFLQSISDSTDVSLLHNLLSLTDPAQTVAYIPSMYFYAIPMAMGDCQFGLGNLEDAVSEYQSVLAYPYINRAYEIPKLWTKLAQAYLAMGDRDYRNAGADATQFGPAKADYEHIVKSDGTLDAGSVLYADARFAPIKARVQAFITGGLKAAFPDNPQLLAPVVEASLKLKQIAAGFDYFGLSTLPPFSWQYLQNTAKYFAQQASQMEQRYIQYQSAGEDETLQRQQLDQQAQVAAQTVILEQRGVDEAQAGVNVAAAAQNYANVQVTNAQQAQAEFANDRGPLAEYGELEAWANAASVDQGSEVSLTISGYSYYNVSGQRRSIVIQDLETRRTKIDQDEEAAKLSRDVSSAQAYAAQAQAQVAQAQTQVAVAQQRVVLAQLQQRDAEENRDYLDNREFSARLWFDLAKNARRISQRYTDMATTVALLAERAYNAETGRNLKVIRYDYTHSSTDNLMGADFLALDLDYFTYDYVTTTKTKKAPVKRIISMADNFPTAFARLKATGRCTFQTELAMFDRQTPGQFLTKTRNVELVFVGITSANIAGTLRNVGSSRFRQADGSIVTRIYPADVMPLSSYELRQDALAFRVDPNDLQLFENNGVDTMWQLDMPLSANDIDFSSIVDVQLVLYYDGFFDASLEATIKAGLPKNGSATRVTSARLTFPDELYFLRGQGQAQLVFDATMFPQTQTNLIRKTSSMRISADATTLKNLTVRVKSLALGTELVVKPDPTTGQIAGAAAGDPLATLNTHPVFDTLTVSITAADNPQLVSNGKLAVGGITDVMTKFDYSFDYR